MDNLKEPHQLHSEILQVNGYYTPGGSPTVYRHVGSDAKFVAVHELGHRDMVLNTLYGAVLGMFVSDPKGIDSNDEEASVLLQSLIPRAWQTLEGHATWAELLAVAGKFGHKEALKYFLAKPANYRLAAEMVLSPSALEFPHHGMMLATVCAVTEYALDRRAVVLANSVANFRELGLKLAAVEVGPDDDLIDAQLLFKKMMNGGFSSEFGAAKWKDWLEPPAGQTSAELVSLFRDAVAAMKLGMGREDALLSEYGLPADAFSRECLRTVSDQLKHGSAARSVKPVDMLNDDIEYRRPLQAKIDHSLIEIELASIPDAVAEAKKDSRCVLVAMHDMAGVLLDRIDEIFHDVPPHSRQQVLDVMLQSNSLKTDGARCMSRVHLITVQINDTGAVTKQQLTCWCDDDQFQALSRTLDEHFKERWIYLVSAVEMRGVDWVHQSAHRFQNRAFVALKMHGTQTCRRVAKQIGPLDYHWHVSLAEHGHVIAFGQSAGPTYFSIGPGTYEDFEDRATTVLGIKASEPDLNAQQLQNFYAAICATFDLAHYEQ